MNWNCRTTASIIHYCTFHLFLNEKTLDLRFCFDFVLLIVSAVCFGKELLLFFPPSQLINYARRFWSKQGSFGTQTEFNIRACAYIRYQLQTFRNVVMNEIKRTTHFHPLSNVICRLKRERKKILSFQQFLSIYSNDFILLLNFNSFYHICSIQYFYVVLFFHKQRSSDPFFPPA